MITVNVSRKDAAKHPGLIWNAFVDVLALRKYAELSAEQRPAHLVFWYENEVQNGGHMQYFENRGVERLEDTFQALGLLGAVRQQQILREAGALFLSRPREKIQTVKEFTEKALEDEFAEFDNQFYDCSPSLQECLERHLTEHQSNFVTIV